MEIILDKISKRFTTGWILKDISVNIAPQQKLAVTGPNGSGKSTLIKIISGYLSPTQGQLEYKFNDKLIDRDNIHTYCSLSAAYTELDEEFSVLEIYNHYNKFKPYLTTNAEEFLEVSGFKKEKNNFIKNFSSGMKQRLGLALAMCMDCPLLILDEPTSFLDNRWKKWYQNLIKDYAQNKTVVIASNEAEDFQFCDEVLALT